MTGDAQPQLTANAHRQHYRVTLAVLAVSALAYALLQTMVVPALPTIQHKLHASTTSVTWVLTVYLLSASVATPVLGRLGDMFGKEHSLLAVLAVFAAGLLVSALSHSLVLLIVGRTIQGVAGAVFPLAFGVIRDEFPKERVATGIGLISATFGIGGGAGLVLSGVIVDHLSYEWIFWFGLIVTVIALVATRLFVPESPVKSPAKIDWAGTVLMSAGLVCLLLAVSEGPTWGWGSARVVALFVAAVVILALFTIVERRVRAPLINIGLMRLRGVWTTNLAGLLIGFGMFGSFVLIPQFVETPPHAGYGFGSSVIQAGVFLLPSAGVMLVAAPLASWLGNRFGSKLPLMLGTLIATGAFVLLSVAHSERWEIYLAGLLLGIGVGFAFASMANLIVEAVPQTHTGEATGINTIMRSIGGALGAQIAASIVAGHLNPRTGISTESGYTVAFAMSAVGVLVAFLASLLVPTRRAVARSRAPAPGPEEPVAA
ncbi:MFS transporter [Conexibacter sp. DBS9H8]|uniref:MFS transporter n=1 Tax=Conexibacter sp. DBS9H8 TaxID=2937801 RepID=UPI00200D1184|nr:MFS transporter [Conexibacter sp. DBS9H8]